jgi:uncharacterized protein
MALDTLIVKFAAPCNLACTYCYEYSSGDETWKTKPKFLSQETARQIGELIRAYTSKHDLTEFKVVAHGGEPLLMGTRRLDETFKTIRQAARPANVKFSLQTNCTLIDENFCRVFRENGVVIGASLDGGTRTHNSLRIDHGKKSAWDKISAGLEVLRLNCPDNYGGLLCVVNTDHDPHEVIDGLMAFNPPMIDLLQPFMSLDSAGNDRKRIAAAFGEWMVSALHHWLDKHGHTRTKIRYFEDALRASVTGRPTTDWFGPRMISYLVIETDGKIDVLDQLKAVGAASSACRALERTVWDCDFDEALKAATALVSERLGNLLPDECLGCRWADVCGAGHLPSRFSQARGFNNRSTYCEGIQMVLDECRLLMEPLICAPKVVASKPVSS